MRQPENQPLLLEHIGSGSAKTSGYNDPGGSQGYDEKQPSDEESNPSASFADGFSSWSDSMHAFHQAIFHGIIYIGIGVVFYSFILSTKFTVIDSIYFSVCIFTTVGYGDLSPDATVAGMTFTIFYAMYGIIILGIFLGILGDIAIERQQKLNKEISRYASTKYLNTLTNPSEANDEASSEYAKKPFLYDIYGIVKQQRMNIIILIVLAIPVFILEKWSFVRGIYWFIITATTVGLGDEFPSHEWSKLICIFYVPLAVAFGGSFLGQIATAYVDKRNDATEAQFLNRALNGSALEKMDSNHDNIVTKDEFLVYMLKTLDKVEQDDIDKILELFGKLDRDDSGSLTKEDIQFIPEQTAKLHYNEKQNRANKRSLFQTR